MLIKHTHSYTHNIFISKHTGTLTRSSAPSLLTVTDSTAISGITVARGVNDEI